MIMHHENMSKMAVTKEKHLAVERYPLSSRFVFADCLHHSGRMTPPENALIVKMNKKNEKFVSQKFNKVAYLYLQAPAETCLERIKKRGRESETNIDFEYLKYIGAMYDRVFTSPTWRTSYSTVIDASKTIVHTYAEVRKIIMKDMEEDRIEAAGKNIVKGKLIFKFKFIFIISCHNQKNYPWKVREKEKRKQNLFILILLNSPSLIFSVLTSNVQP